MKSFRSLLARLAALAAILLSPSAHAGVPVIDVANLAQAVSQVLAWGDQYDQMVQQINQFQQQVDTLNATRANLNVARHLGTLLQDPSIQAVLPPEMQAASSLVTGPYSASKADALQALLNAYNVPTATNGTPFTGGQTAADRMLKMQQILQSAQTRGSTVNSLASRADVSDDAKDALDLSNRLALENLRQGGDTAQTIAAVEASKAEAEIRALADSQARMADLKAKSAAAAAYLRSQRP